MQNLSSGVISQFLQGIAPQGPFYFQVLSLKAVVPKAGANPNSQKRFRLLMNDGQNTATMMLANQLVEWGENGQLTEGTIVRVNEIIPNEVQGRKVLIILSIEVVGHQVGVIGNPVAFAEPGAGGATQAPPAAAAGAGAGGYGQPPGPGYGQPPGPGYGQPPGPGGYGQPPAPAYGGAPAGGYGGPSNAPGPSGPRPSGGPGGAPPYGQPVQPPRYGGSGAVAHNDAPTRIVPIKSLNPFTGRWTIKGRCTSKGEMKRWTNMKGEGKLFSFDLLDVGGGEIRCTAFNDMAEKFFATVEVGGVYIVAKASLKHKKPQFNHTNHDFEIQLERESVVDRVADDDESRAIPDVLFNFRTIADLNVAESGSMVDVIGVVESVDNWVTITRKTGEETKKRSMVLRDRSNSSIEFTLWGAMVVDPGEMLYNMAQAGDKPVVAIKGARVGDFNGKTISTVGSSVVRVSPDIPEAHDLQTWYTQGGSAERITALSSGGGGGGTSGKRCTLGAVKNEGLGHGEKPDYVNVSATIVYLKQSDQGGASSVMYPSCPGDYNGRTCSKKLMDGAGQGNWYCERCNKYVEMPEWKYLVSLQASDHTATSWLTLIGDAGDQLFGGLKARELKELEGQNDKEFDKRIWDANMNRMVFRLKVCEETYQDERRIKTNIMRMEPVDYKKECKLTLDYIAKLQANQPVLSAREAAGPPQGQGQGGSGGGAGMGGGGGGGGGAYNANPYANGGGGGGGGGNVYGSGMQQQQQRWQGPGGGGGGMGGGPGAGGGMGYGTPPASSRQGGGPSQYNAGPVQYGGGGGGGGGGYGGPPAGGGGYGGGGPPVGQGQHTPPQGGYGGGGPQGGYGGGGPAGSYNNNGMGYGGGGGQGNGGGGPSYGGPPGGGGGPYGGGPPMGGGGQGGYGQQQQGGGYQQQGGMGGGMQQGAAYGGYGQQQGPPNSYGGPPNTYGGPPGQGPAPKPFF